MARIGSYKSASRDRWSRPQVVQMKKMVRAKHALKKVGRSLAPKRTEAAVRQRAYAEGLSLAGNG